MDAVNKFPFLFELKYHLDKALFNQPMLCCSQGVKKETGTLEGSTRTQMIT